MAASSVQAASALEGRHLVLYDGVCALCSHLIQFLLAHDRGAVFSFASLQSDTGRAMVERFGGKPGELTSFCVIDSHRDGRARMLTRSSAALFVAAELEWPWRAAVLMRIVPAAIRDRMYDVVARTRYRVFGRLDQCLMPSPEFRRRLIDT